MKQENKIALERSAMAMKSEIEAVEATEASKQPDTVAHSQSIPFEEALNISMTKYGSALNRLAGQDISATPPPTQDNAAV